MNTSKDNIKAAGSYTELNGMVLDQEKEYFNMLTIHIKSLEDREPVEINFKEELSNFLGAGLLKPFENEGIKLKYLQVVSESRVQKLAKLCFWQVMATRFPETIDSCAQQEIKNYYQKKISRQYVKLFQMLPQPKSDLITYVIFTVSYLIHFAFYKYFSRQREYFDLRFILNCYHSVLFEFNGLFVSDFYIKTMIEKIFTQRFLDYEQKNMKEILQMQLEIQKLNDKSFLGFDLKIPEQLAPKNKDHKRQQEASLFKDEITNLLKRDLKYYIPQMKRNKQQKSKDNKFGGNEESWNKKGEEDEKPASNINLKLNCSQVSPTFGRLLEYENLNLPFKKKKMINHQFEKIEGNSNQLLNQMKSMLLDKNEINAKKKEHKYQGKGKSLIDQYGLHGPTKEYYEKSNSSSGPLFKDMYDMNYVLTEENESLNKLPSSAEFLSIMKSKDGGKSKLALDRKQLEDKVVDQTKSISIIENIKSEQGNQDVFNLPFTGTRSEGRKLISYVRQKCRSKLDEKDNNALHQSTSVIKQDQSKMQRNKSEIIKTNSSFVLPPLDVNIISQQKLTQLNQKSVKSPDIGPLTANPGDKKNIINQVQFNLMNVNNMISRSNSIFQIPKAENSKVQKEGSFGSSENKQSSSNLENMLGVQRKLLSKIVQREQAQKPIHHGNLPEFILERSLDSEVVYQDKRNEYKKKYNSIFNSISVDQNINDLCLNILQKRNMMSHGVKKSKH